MEHILSLNLQEAAGIKQKEKKNANRVFPPSLTVIRNVEEFTIVKQSLEKSINSPGFTGKSSIQFSL